MCGRYSLGVSAAELAEVFEAEAAELLVLPRWNVAPTQHAPVVVRTREGDRTITALRWGLVPHWAPDAAGAARHINARSETVASTPAFRDAFARRRCLVPADGFYEWASLRGRGTLPHWIHHARGGLLAFAGVRESWRPPNGEGEPLQTFAVLTTTPNALVAPLHDRMPVVLDPDRWDLWLDPEAPLEAVRALLAPAPADLLAAWPVSTRVNRVENDDARCVEPVPPEPELLDLFEGR